MLAVLAIGLALAPDAGEAPPARGPEDAAPERRATRDDRPEDPFRSAARIEVLGDLGPGAQLAGWRVDALAAASGDRARVTVSRGEVSFEIIVVPAGSEPHPPPVSTSTHDLFYSRPSPEGESVADADRDAVLEAIADRVRMSESD